MKTKRIKFQLVALCVLSLIGVTTLSSFEGDSGSSGGGSLIFAQATPEVDCSTNVIVYGYTNSNGSGSGSIGYGSGGASGSASGGGGSSTTTYGPIGMVYTPQKKMDCKLAWYGSCNDVACHATGSGVFTPFKK